MRFIRRITIAHALCAFLILLGAAAYTAQCAIDVVSALRHTTDETGRLLQPLLIITMAGMTFGLGSFAGLRFRAGDKVIGTVCFLLATYFLFYSFSNSVGFSFEQTVGKQRLVEAQNQQAKDIAEIQAKQAREMQQGISEFAKRTYSTAHGRAAKAEARELLKESLTTTVPVVVPKITEVMPDGKAEAFGGWLGIAADKFRLLDSVYLAFGICLIKWIAPALGFGYWPRGSREQIAAPVPVPAPVDPRTLPQPVRTVDTEERQASELALVKEWLATRMVHTPGDQQRTILATEAYQNFARWAQGERRMGQVLTQTAFGNRMKELGVEKVKVRGMLYVGLSARATAPIVPLSSHRRIAVSA